MLDGLLSTVPDRNRATLTTRLRALGDPGAIAQRGAMVMSRFFPSVASLLAVFADMHFFGGQQSTALGFVISAIMVPQVIDLGHTRRLTIEAGLKGDPGGRETQIETSFRAFLLLALLIGCVIGIFAVSTVPSLRAEGFMLVPSCLLAGLSTALAQLMIALLYWRGSRRPLASVAVDPLLLLLFGGLLIWRPTYTIAWLSGFLVLRSMIALAVAGYGIEPLRLMTQMRQGLITVIVEARAFGHIELQLSLFCFVAWAIDPLLYGYFPAGSGTAQHLLATRFSQLAVNLTNVFLIGNLWRSATRGTSEARRGRLIRAFMLWMLAAIAVAAVWNAMRTGSDIRSLAIYLSVFAGTAVAIVRQKATLELLSAGGDMRSGASLPLIAAIAAIKGTAVLLQNVVIFEFASVVASIIYLQRMSRHV